MRLLLQIQQLDREQLQMETVQHQHLDQQQTQGQRMQMDEVRRALYPNETDEAGIGTALQGVTVSRLACDPKTV